MILRRLAEAFRKQDWFTVAVEILIVVIGVFIGLQVNNWNTARVERADSRIILERLEQDFEQILDRSDLTLAKHASNLAAVGRLIHGVRNKQFDEETLLQDMTDATSLSSPPGTSTTFTQLVSSGRLELIRSHDLRRSLTEYDTYTSFVRSQYGTFERPVTRTRHTLMQASTLRVTGIPASFEEIYQQEAVDRDMLFSNPEMMTALQTVYGVHENVHAFVSRNRAGVAEILAQIRAELEAAP